MVCAGPETPIDNPVPTLFLPLISIGPRRPLTVASSLLLATRLGRLAMIAVTVYALEEYVTKAPIVEDTAFLFQPIWTLGGASQAVTAAAGQINPALGIKEVLVDPLM